jgi:hypothetical protein
VKLSAIQLGNGGLRFLRLCHLYKREAARLTGVPICHDIHTFNATVSGKRTMKLLLGCLIAQISDKNVGHDFIPFSANYLCQTALATNL